MSRFVIHFNADSDTSINWSQLAVYRPEGYSSWIYWDGFPIAVVKKHIPRGFRKEYTPWVEWQRLYGEFANNGDPEIADKLLPGLDVARGQRWTKIVGEMRTLLNPALRINNKIVEALKAHAIKIKKELETLRRASSKLKQSNFFKPSSYGEIVTAT
ncbi:hypothetical protein QE152_g10273 [Popillia japonica]|uniref:Uncharacterized protein n=1 Tax=Popillia japonica TaxID=7064 RepID=A0AAW1LV61_POPJA